MSKKIGNIHMKFYKLFLVTSIMFLSLSYVFAQTQDAEDFFAEENYPVALKKYLLLANKEGKNAAWNYKIGQCYIKINGNKKLALNYFLKAQNLGYKGEDIIKNIALSYHYNNDFDKAIESYKKYLENGPKKEREWTKRQIEMCINGKELFAKPLNVSFTHLGKEINSEFPDYYPFITGDESFLVYTTRRPGGLLEMDGYYTSDIYISEVKKGQFSRAKSIGNNINTKEDEQCVGLTHDGKKMLVYIDHVKVYGDIYITNADEKRQFSDAEPLPVPINSKSLESAASINADESMLAFASRREGGFGGNDIYFARKLPNGLWGEPQNAGPNINSKYDEEFPQISAEGKILYFSSQGHNSMGDFDIFISKLDAVDNIWSKPVNLGYPVNTTYADMNYTCNASQRVAYVSSLREGSFGDYDIWKITYKDNEEELTFVKGTIYVDDSVNFAKIDIPIEIINKATNEVINGSYKYKAKSKKFSLALEPGKYILKINHQNFQPFQKNLDILDKKDFKKVMQFPIMLKENKGDLNIKKNSATKKNNETTPQNNIKKDLPSEPPNKKS